MQIPYMKNLDQLIEVSPGHHLHPDVGQALQIMQIAAEKESISIDLASSYRSVNRQLAIWNAKWKGEKPIYDRKNQLVDPSSVTDRERLHCILIFSALPGASRHHWGTDIDVYDKPAMDKAGQSLELIESEYSKGGPCYPLYQWLQEHAQKYDFYFPYAEDMGGVAKEPWHISHRPTSELAMQALSLKNLEQSIKNMDIQGKTTILDNLSDVYHRYVLNKGV